jgi:hypothetical protein
MAAFEPFLRPEAYQSFPDELPPQALKNDQALAPWRLVDRAPTRKPIQEPDHALT